MRDLRLWDKTSNLNMMGKMHTPAELMVKYPAQTDGDCVLEYISPNIVGGIDNLITWASVYNVEVTGEPQEVLNLILAEMAKPAPPSTEERIASQLEFQSMMMIPDNV